MATILAFRRLDVSSQAPKADYRSNVDKDQSADIIIFPGVRIERMEDGAAAGNQPATASGRHSETVRRD